MKSPLKKARVESITTRPRKGGEAGKINGLSGHAQPPWGISCFIAYARIEKCPR